MKCTEIVTIFGHTIWQNNQWKNCQIVIQLQVVHYLLIWSVHGIPRLLSGAVNPALNLRKISDVNDSEISFKFREMKLIIIHSLRNNANCKCWFEFVCFCLGALIYGVVHGPYKASNNSISPLLTLRLVELLPALEDLMTTLAIMTKHPTSTSRIR